MSLGKQSTIPRYYAFLMELKEEIQKNPSTSVNVLAERYCISKDVYNALKNLKIFEVYKKVGTKHHKRWTGGMPDIQLAEKVHHDINNRAGYVRKCKVKKEGGDLKISDSNLTQILDSINKSVKRIEKSLFGGEIT